MTMEDTELRTRLELLAHRTAPPTQDVDDLVATVTVRTRAKRRRQWAVAAAAVLALTYFVVVPGIRATVDRDTDPAAPAAPTGVYTTPTRGYLSGEVDFLEGVRQRPWTTAASGEYVAEPPLATRRVVFATEQYGARWVLVAGADPTVLPPNEGVDAADLDALGSVAIAWFTGPLNAVPEEMRVYGEPAIVDADEPTAVLAPTEPFGSSSESFVAVVAAPGDQIAYSGLRFIDADGEITRDSFEAADTQDGYVATGAGQVDASIDHGLRYRVTRRNTELSVVPITEPAPDFVPPRVNLARLRPAPSPAPGDAAVASAIDGLLSHLGMWAHVWQFTVLWAGDLPTPDDSHARVTVLAGELDGGGVYLAGTLGRTSGGRVIAGSCGSETRPAGTSLDELVVVLRCGSDGTPEDAPMHSLVVVAPPRATTAQAFDDRGQQVASYPLVDGVAVVPLPPGLASVVVLDAAGETVDGRIPMAEVDWSE
jgi:hypothetical protein